VLVNPQFKARNLAELIDTARSAKGAVAYASSGNGSAQHLAGALFESATQSDMVHVPYKGGGPALNDVIGGQVPLFFGNLASTLQHVQSGRLRALAVTSAQRSTMLPEVPTLAEAGVKGAEIHEWNALFVPAATPEAVVAKLAGALQKAMASPDVRARIAQLGGEAFKGDPKAASEFIQAQMVLWARVIKDRQITTD
jgi:tripartite-type tricarboxylate transporter receptor subunit TctC